MKIREFRDKYRFLSNFHACKVIYDNITFDSVEKAYQYSKCYKASDKAKILEAKTSKEAKAFGKLIKIRSDWDRVRVSIMLDLVTQKFSADPLRQMLLDTGDDAIIEENWWHDNLWGNCTCDKCRTIRGHNILGKIIMQVRDSLKGAYDEDREEESQKISANP